MRPRISLLACLVVVVVVVAATAAAADDCASVKTCESCLTQERDDGGRLCAFYLEDARMGCRDRTAGTTEEEELDEAEAVKVEILDGRFCGLVTAFVESNYLSAEAEIEGEEVFSTTPEAVASENEAGDEEEPDIGGDLSYFSDYDVDDEEEEEEKDLELEDCNDGDMELWAFLGGLLMGGAAGAAGLFLAQLCLRRRKDKQKNYNEPYSFDAWVNP